MRLRKESDDPQPESHGLRGLVRRAQSVEEVSDVSGRDALSVVSHRYPHIVLGGARVNYYRGQAVAECVAGQIHQYLFEALPVCPHRQVRIYIDTNERFVEGIGNLLRQFA